MPVTGPALVPIAVAPFVGGLQVHEYALSNGLRLLVVPDHTAPVVAWQTWYGVGSSDGVASKTGLAHFFEHMMFKATVDYPDGYYDSTLDTLGAGDLDAWTWYDETVFVQSVPVAGLPTVARLERQRMTGLLVDAERLEKEREVIINERRLRVDDDPTGAMGELLWSTAFSEHRYGWPTIGWMEDLERLTAEDFQAFYRTWYAPNNATIVMVGDVDPDEAAGLVLAEYGALEPSTLPDPAQSPEPEQLHQRRVERDLPITSDRIAVGFRVPADSDADLAVVQVLDAILTGGRSGFLKRELVGRGAAAAVWSDVVGHQEPSLWTFWATAQLGVSAEVLEELLFAELARVVEEGLDDSDLRRGVNQASSAAWSRWEDAAGKASALGWAFTTTGDWRGAPARLRATETVRVQDLERVAAEVLQAERATVVVGRAIADPDAQPVAEVEPGPRSPAVETRPVVARPPAPPPELERGDIVTEEVHGASVHMVYDPSVALVDLRIGWPVGSAHVAPGLANLAAQMLLRGTRSRGRLAFEEAVEALGASVAIYVGVDTVELHVRVLRQAWPELLALLQEALQEPTFDDSALADLVLEVKSKQQANLDRDRYLATRALLSGLYPDHPYGIDPLGHDLGAIGPEDLRAFVADHLRSQGAVMGVAGGFDSAALNDLRSLMGAIQGRPVEVALPPLPPPATERRVILVDHPDRSQCQVAIGSPGPRHQDPDFASWSLANEVFGSRGFGGRLMKELRRNRGWSYYAWSRLTPMVHGGPWMIMLGPGNEYAVQAVELVLGMAEEADSSGFTDEETDPVRTARVRSSPFLVDTAKDRMVLDFDRRLIGYDELALVHEIESVSTEQASRAFAEALEPDGLLIVVVGTAERVQEGLARLGPVQVVPYTEVR